MGKLIAAFLIAIAALFTFSVFTVLSVYAGMRIERRRAFIAQQARIVKLVADAKRAAKQPVYKVEIPPADEATRKAAQA